MTVTDFLILFAILAAVAIDGHLTRRKLTKMSQALDDLTASVTALETASGAAVTEIASLASGGDTAALPALKARIDTVAANLTTAATPAPQ